MSEENNVNIPFFVHEGEMTRMERMVRRLWILILIMLIALIGTNVGWLIYESQFETETTTSTSYEATADNGSNAVLNGSGEVRIYGGIGESNQGDCYAEGAQIQPVSENLP